MATRILTSTSNLLSKFRPVVFTPLQARMSASVVSSMQKDQVVPDVIPVAPPEVCTVSFLHRVTSVTIVIIKRISEDN